jgi:guanylate kinase
MSPRLPEHEAFLKEITDDVRMYRRPNDIVAAFAHRLSVQVIFGPAGAGKSTLMTKSKLPRVTTVTSRSPKPSDAQHNQYRKYLDFTVSDNCDEVRQGLRLGTYVQIARHPASGEIYATERSDFTPRVINVLDATCQEYYNIRRRKLFGQLNATCVIPPTFEQLDKQYTERDNPSEEEYVARLQEGYDALKYGLNDPDINFFINFEPEESAERLKNHISGKNQLTYAQGQVGRVAAMVIMRKMYGTNLVV